MYIPDIFAAVDEKELIEFMREFNFGVLITAENEIPYATHLPFVTEVRGEKIYVLGHLAKANPHWRQFGDKDVLLIFQGPHAYVSPMLYEGLENVPTWNYLAVHASGKLTTLSPDENLIILEKQVAVFDPYYFETNWKTLSTDYKIRLAKGVVAFEIEVTNLQGKKKLNQNKTGIDADNVIQAFEKSTLENEQLIAKYMKEIHQKKN